MSIEYAIILKSKTRLESLIERFNTRAQARFYIERSGGDFQDYELEHDMIQSSVSEIQRRLSNVLKYKIIDRTFLPSFIFSEKNLIITVGQDGLVANTAKYSKELPIIAVNPDPNRFDGVLLPFNSNDFLNGVEKVIRGSYDYSKVTMAEARMNDGQRLLAFNDFFIGAASHISARYKITYRGRAEEQSSSGIIVSTGAGSTGWLSSVFNMSNGISTAFGRQKPVSAEAMAWDSEKLVFVVREPFRSKKTQAGLTAGYIERSQRLTIESYMPSNGVIFSDGIEADFIRFNSGSVLTISLAREKATIVMNS